LAISTRMRKAVSQPKGERGSIRNVWLANGIRTVSVNPVECTAAVILTIIQDLARAFDLFKNVGSLGSHFRLYLIVRFALSVSSSSLSLTFTLALVLIPFIDHSSLDAARRRRSSENERDRKDGFLAPCEIQGSMLWTPS
jgi:hypothetical protein